MLVEPRAGDRLEDNLNPVGAIYYSASTLLCTPASRSQEVGRCPRRPGGRGAVGAGLQGGGVHPVPPGGRHPVQRRLRDPALTVSPAASRAFPCPTAPAPHAAGPGAGHRAARSEPPEELLDRSTKHPALEQATAGIGLVRAVLGSGAANRRVLRPVPVRRRCPAISRPSPTPPPITPTVGALRGGVGRVRPHSCHDEQEDEDRDEDERGSRTEDEPTIPGGEYGEAAAGLADVPVRDTAATADTRPARRDRPPRPSRGWCQPGGSA